MKLSRRFSKTYFFRRVTLYLMICCLVFSMSSSTTLAGPKGKALGHSKFHGNPQGELHSIGVLTPINTKVNPAGIIVGPGRIKFTGMLPNIPNTAAATNPGGRVIGGAGSKSDWANLATASGEKVLIAKPGSNVFVEIGGFFANEPSVRKTENNAKIHISGQPLVLAAGDAFSEVIADLGGLASSLTVPEVIGAKGPNPVHGGQHPKKGNGNPGGGNGKGHWGDGNKGNGVGNVWTGNQGHGVGEGMAGGPKQEPGPEPNPQPQPEPEINIDAAPLPQITLIQVEQKEFEKCGCPALMKWLVDELGVAEDIQIHIANTFVHSTDIEPCKAAARLNQAAKILADADGVAALERVINEFVAPGVPISEEQMASIATAFEEHAGDNTYYAAAGQWIDALAEYVGVLTDEIGYSAEESVAIVMDKYGAPVGESGNASMIAYIEARLAALTGKTNHHNFPEPQSLQSLGEETKIKNDGTDALIQYASTESTHTFGGSGILAAGGAILAGGLAIAILLSLPRSKQHR